MFLLTWTLTTIQSEFFFNLLSLDTNITVYIKQPRKIMYEHVNATAARLA